MNIFVAGASGAIGQPLIAELVRQGHTVAGMTQSEAGAARLRALGATPHIVNAFDAPAVEKALRDSAAEIVIDELTALPQNPDDLPKAAPGDRKLRLEGGGNLHRAALAVGVRRYIQQASGFFLKATPGTLADESSPLATDATPAIATSAQMYTTLEQRVLAPSAMEGIALRYGFFYGPNTWYTPDGLGAEQVRRKELPLVGDANGVWSWIHIEDAARATVAALTAEPGIYNIVDDDPSPMNVWLPAFARFLDAPEPARVPKIVAKMIAGEDAVYYSNQLSGASNAKARRILNFQPRRLEWLA